MRVGLISDTHGLIRPQALAALAGADVIIHAGDVGKPNILDALGEIAPVHTIRGNVDRWANDLPDQLDLRLAGRRVVVVHDGKRFTPPAGTDVVICGHSHKPYIDNRDGVLFVNPGSAGPRRFSLPIAVGWLLLGVETRAEIIQLTVPPRRRTRPG